MEFDVLRLISEMIIKLDNYERNNENNRELERFISELKIIFIDYFGEENDLTKSLGEIKFKPCQPYFPEMKEKSLNEAWNTGVNQLKKLLSRSLLKIENSKINDNLEQIISNAEENKFVEFKSTLRWDIKENKVNKDLEDVVVKTICAFNNTDGGTLLIGVDDNGNVLGLETDYLTLKDGNKDKFELHFRNLLQNHFPILYITENLTITFHNFEEKEICCVKVKKGITPLCIKLKKNGQNKEVFFLRVGNQSKEPENISEIIEYVLNRFRNS